MFILGFLSCWFLINIWLTTYHLIKEINKLGGTKNITKQHAIGLCWKIPIMYILALVIIAKDWFEKR